MVRRIIATLFLVGIAFVAFAVWGAIQDPVVVRYRLAMPGLRAPLRIVQLSDTHASAIDMPAQRLARVVAQMNALKPDMIVLTGDYLSGVPESWSAAETRAAVAPFAALRAPLGVFAVAGNHDDRRRTRAGLAGGPVRLLVSEWVDAGPVVLVGADDISRGSPAVEALRRAIRGAPRGKPLVVVVHDPVAVGWLQGPPALMIAGHTHGGQFSLPGLGALSFGAFYAAHQRGVFQEGRHRLLVSSGLGTTGVPMRIGVPPEIVELTLLPDQVGRNSGTER